MRSCDRPRQRSQPPAPRLDNGASSLVVRALALEAGRLELDGALAVCLVLSVGWPTGSCRGRARDLSRRGALRQRAEPVDLVTSVSVRQAASA